LVALSIAEKDIDPVRRAVTQSRERHAARHRESMAQRAGRHFDSRNTSVRGVAGEWRTVAAIGVQPTSRKEAPFSECGIQHGGRMALAENEAIARGQGGAPWIHSKHATVQYGQDVSRA